MATAADPVPAPAGAASAAPEVTPRGYVARLRQLTLWVVGVGVVARLFRYALDGSIWNDEAAVALNLLRRDFEGLTHALDERQVAPVLFLWAERAVMLLLGNSGLALRLVPLLFGLAGLVVYWDFARRAARPTAAAFAIGIVAVARWPVMMSSTLKPYTADMLCSTLLMALAVRWRQNPERAWPLVALALVVPFCLGLSYPTVFVAGAVSLYLLPAVWQRRDRRSGALFAYYNFAALAGFVAVYALVLRQASDPPAADLKEFMRDYWKHGFPPTGPLDFVWWAVKIHTGRLMSFPWGDGNGGSTLTTLLFLTGIWACWRSGNRSLLVLCLTPFALNFAAAVLRQYPYGACTRLSMHLAPAICLMIGTGLARLVEAVPLLRKRLAAATTVLVVFALFGAGEMIADACKPHREQYGRWMQGLYRELEPKLRPGDTVVYRCPIPNQRETFDWYVGRVAERAASMGPTAGTGRVWVIVVTATAPGYDHERELVAGLGDDWRTVTRTEYMTVPVSRGHATIHGVVHCLERSDPE
ncbi:glycosyltransferase family 39 protein [Gemmata sp.]|uniref:glycosyltransferase family 39 protein n=1 Tax=Gemmata sp. TaxID=1914242 RepID=UPI003F6FABC1